MSAFYPHDAVVLERVRLEREDRNQAVGAAVALRTEAQALDIVRLTGSINRLELVMAWAVLASLLVGLIIGALVCR